VIIRKGQRCSKLLFRVQGGDYEKNRTKLRKWRNADPRTAPKPSKKEDSVIDGENRLRKG